MKIAKISIKNYRSCKNTEFSPHNELTALIGPNGSGKTNILSAINLLSSLVYGRHRARYRIESLSTACEIKTWFDMDGKTVIHTASINTATNERNEDEVLDSNENWYMPQVINSRKKNNLPLAAIPDIDYYIRRIGRRRLAMRGYLPWQLRKDLSVSELNAMKKVAKFIEGFAYYSASQFTNPSNCPISFEVEEVEAEGRTRLRRGMPNINSHKAFLYDLYVERKNNTKAFSQFMDIVGPSGIGLIEKIEFNEIKTSSSNVSVSTGGRVRKREKINLLIVPGFKVSGDTLSPSQLSEGTFKTLALIFYLIADKSTMLMIEEPEVCVHHGLLNSIIELVNTYSKEKQIFVSTHSDAVLDKVDISNVFAVRRINSEGTSVKSISKSLIKKNEMNVLKEYLTTEGSLGEYWRHGDLENA